MNKFKILLCCGLALAVSACSSAQKADLSAGDDIHKAVDEVQRIKQNAEKQQIDLLAYDQFEEGRHSLSKARIALENGYKPEIILEHAAIAKAYFLDAEKAAMPRKDYSTRLLTARQSALNAGLRNSTILVDGLADVDDDLRSDTSLFREALTPEDFSVFQKRYLDLETKAVQYRELNDVSERIQKAVGQDAKELADKTLHAAKLDYEDARNIIEQSPRNPELYRDGVNKSIASSILLADVMEVILNAKGTPESIALQIVQQNRKLSSLSAKTGTLEANLQSTQASLKESESMLREKDMTLAQQQEELQIASTQVRFQHAMDTAREQFSEDDALVYQQGTTLVFRLKRINFRSGSSLVPEASKTLLMKVNAIIHELQAENVVVQGHTDSVGSDELNKTLSSLRAKSVAKYLLSLDGGYPLSFIGYGESRPIASNETAEGRAINRRVDLVVTARKL